MTYKSLYESLENSVSPESKASFQKMMDDNLPKNDNGVDYEAIGVKIGDQLASLIDILTVSTSTDMGRQEKLLNTMLYLKDKVSTQALKSHPMAKVGMGILSNAVVSDKVADFLGALLRG